MDNHRKIIQLLIDYVSQDEVWSGFTEFAVDEDYKTMVEEDLEELENKLYKM